MRFLIALGIAATLLIQQFLAAQDDDGVELLIEKANKDARKDFLTWPKTNFSFRKDENSEQFKPIFSDKDLFALGGYEEILDNLADIVRYLQNPTDYCKMGAKAPKGIILSGPPGVGKTFIAEAISGHAGVALFAVSAPELSNSLVGATEKNIRLLFEKASKNAPCIILLDEFDSIAPKRLTSNNGNNEVLALFVNSVVNQLLSMLSQDNPGVVVIATTNHFESLDPAVVRPGRFDRHIRISLPNLEDRKRILEILFKGKNLSSNVSVNDLAAISAGFSGAQLAGWVNEAVICATRDKSSLIANNHFDMARTLISTGVKQKTCTDKKNKLFTAAHEAGHAIVGHLLHRKLYKISTVAYGDTQGHTEWIPPENQNNFTKQDLLDQICLALAGRAAEQLMGTSVVGSQLDLENAKTIANLMVNNEGMGQTILGTRMDVELILEEQMQRAVTFINENKKTWENVRDTLMENDELLKDEFLLVVAGKKIPPKKNWFWQDNPTKTQILPLPAKRNSPNKVGNKSINPFEKSEEIPFTIEEVANVLKIDPSFIRKIQKGVTGGYDIKMKPGFNQGLQLENISEKLKSKNVENHYWHYDKRFAIEADGVEDFRKLINDNRSEQESQSHFDERIYNDEFLY